MTSTQPAGLQVELLDPRDLTSHPRNVRADLGDLTGLTASIAAQGVIEPLTVVPMPDGGHLVVAGHRRAAAAIAAELERVPCVARADLAAAAGAENAGDVAEHVAAMLAENLHREGLTAMEEARGIQAMLDLKVPISKVAKATGLDAKRVKKAIGVARLDDDTAAAVDAGQLDLDQAAAVALFAAEPETAARLVQAAEHGPGNFAHVLARAKQDRDTALKVAKVRADIEAAGRVVVDVARWQGKTDRSLESLVAADGQPLTVEGHASCPGAAVCVSPHHGSTTEVCRDPGKHGHRDRWGSSTTLEPAEKTPEEAAAAKEAAKAERREVIENNKALAAANTVRRAWLKEFLARRTAPKEVLRFAVEEIGANPRAMSTWVGGMTAGGDADAYKELGIERPRTYGDPATTLTTGEHVADGRLPLQLLAHIAGAVETTISRESWRPSPDHRAAHARWLAFLVGQGYTLSDVEQLVVDGAAK